MNSDPNQDPLLMDHEADGIKELDNNLPRWWVWLFNLTIVFAVIYMAYYHVLKAGDLQIAEYTKEQKVGDEIKNSAIAKFESSLTSLEPSKDQAVLGKGQPPFMLPYQLPLFTLVVILLICTLAALVAIRKVCRLEPAVVFRG